MKDDESVDRAALDDSELALALKRGDNRAFDELVRRHQGRVYAVAYRLTNNREDALDVAQESLLKAYRKISAWQPTGGFLPWLLRLTTNQAIDHLRRRKRQRHEQLTDALSPADDRGITASSGPFRQNGPTGADTGQQVRAHEIDARIRHALRVLSESQRTVFVLRHYEGLQLADIAAELGCTVGSVKVHLFRAMKKLQRELTDLYES